MDSRTGMDHAAMSGAGLAAGPEGSGIDHDQLRSILSNLSHELSRPLTSLRVGFDLLLTDSARPLSPAQRGHVQTMVEVCDDLLKLTRSYLDYAGLVQGTRPPHFGTFTVGALIGEMDRQFAATAAAGKIAWSCGLDGPDAPVTTDASRCQQILGNIVANALKYTQEGGEVRVAGRVERGQWTMTVVDNGPGIPPEHQERVFEPFYRLPRDAQSRVDGNGLGLAICRGMVDQLGGQIHLLSSAGEGTTVTVRLPVKAPELSSKATPANPPG